MKLIDKYTILDFSQSIKYYKRDKALTSNFNKVLEEIKKILENITKIDFAKILSHKLNTSTKKDELYTFFENILNYLMERINVLALITVIKDNVSFMNSNFDKYNKMFKELQENNSGLNKKLEEFKKYELDFKKKIIKKFRELPNEWNELNFDERKKKEEEVFRYSRINSEEYLNNLDNINKKIIPYTKAQNEAFISCREKLSYLIEYLYKNKIINKNEKDAHEKAFFYEVETLEDIYTRNKKFYKVLPLSWRELINSSIDNANSENDFQIIKEMIKYLIIDKKDYTYLLEKYEKFYHFHQIIFGENKDLKLSDLFKKDSSKIELLKYLNLKRISKKNLTKEKITQICDIFLELQAKFIREKNYESGGLIYIISSTYYYENEKGEKMYISDIIRDKESFKNEEFIANMIVNSIKNELKKMMPTEINKNNVMNSQITSYLGVLSLLGFDKNFAMNILTKVLELIGFDEKNDGKDIQFYKKYVNTLYVNNV